MQAQKEIEEILGQRAVLDNLVARVTKDHQVHQEMQETQEILVYVGYRYVGAS